MPLPPRVSGGTRRLYRDIVLGTTAASGRSGLPPGAGLPPGTRSPSRVRAGTILDAAPHLLVLDGMDGETRLPMTSTTTVWHGGRGGPAALRPGREVIVRMSSDGPDADHIWVDIGRITGTILAYERNTVEVDMGPHRGRTSVVIPPHILGRILVRHPRLEPGYLIDVICVSSPDGPRAARPGTSQPGYLPADLAAPRPDVPVPDVLRGTVTWFGGAAYAPPTQSPTIKPPSAPTPPVSHPTKTPATGPAATGTAAPEAEDSISPDAMSWPDIGTGTGLPFTSPSPSSPGPASEDSDGSKISPRRRDRHTKDQHTRSRTGPRHASPVRKSLTRKRTTTTAARPDNSARTARPGAGPAFLLTGEHGAAYPFVDPEGDDAGACPDTPPGCVALPYLSLGSELTLHNECARVLATLPVIECGCVAARYCDRCVECGTSPRGRLAELTPAAFVALGGDLGAGCFNAVLRLGAALRNDTLHPAEG